MQKIPFTPSEIITARELADLCKLSLEIAALQGRCHALYPANWFKAAAEARSEFRRNPSADRTDALLELLMQDPDHAVNHRCFEKVRDDLTLGACHIFGERGRPVLLLILARAASCTAAVLKRTLELDEQMSGGDAERFAGPLPKTKQVVALEEMGAVIERLRGQVSAPVAPSQFPGGIGEVLEKVGVDLEMQISEFATAPLDPPPVAPTEREAMLAKLTDAQLIEASHQYGVIIYAANFDRATAIQTILAIAPQ